ncbi:MAG TPA: prohibitin family protein [Anaerolineae bacterium]|nr:prohibitin family protein [Anaerolineae bacterium]
MLIDQTIQFITYALWAIFIVFIVAYLTIMTRRRGFNVALRGLLRYTLLFVLTFILFVTYIDAGLVFVEPQEVGVVVSVPSPQGYQDHPYRSGLRWIVPFLETMYRYPISWQTYTMSSNPIEGAVNGDDSIRARTLDGQEVSLDSSEIFQIDPDQVVRIHIDWQGRYLEDFVRPVTRGVVRTIVSQYQADEVNSSKRLDLERDINDQLRQTFAEKGFLLDRFILRNIAFSPEYALEIEKKQVAQQGIIESQHKADQVRELARGEADAVLTKAQADAQATLLRAQAESNALKLIDEALAQDKSLLIYRYIDKLSPAIKVMLVPSNAPYLLPLPDLNVGETITSTISPTTTVTGTVTAPVLPTTITTTLPISTTIP